MKLLLTEVTNCKTLSIILFYVLCITTTGAGARKDGNIAKMFDEYYSTIKCMANIMEDLMPEADSLMMCCGAWIMHDWMGSMVMDNCYEHNYHQINNMTRPFILQMETNCQSYPRDSFSCKLMIVTPITLLVILILLILSLCICAVVTCLRLRRYQRYHEYHKSQGFDSAGTDETTDSDPTAPPSAEKKKALEAMSVWKTLWSFFLTVL